MSPPHSPWLLLGALLPLSGCGLVRQVEAVPVEGLSTVVRVTWHTSTEVDGYVDFGPLGDCDRYQTPLVGPGTDHEALLLGLPPVSEACYRVVATDDGFHWPQGYETVQTGNLPAAVPNLEVPIHERALVEDGFFLAASGTTPGLVLILDRDGEVVWYQPAEEGFVSPQAQPDPTTGGFIYNRFSKDFSQDVGTVRRVAPDGEQSEEVRTPLAHHSFEQLADGTIAWLAIDVREHGDEDVVGDAVREVDPDGVDRAVWSTWDDWTPGDLTDEGREFYPQGIDWTHGNFLSWSQGRQSYTVSFRNVDTVVELDRDGDLVRAVGGHGTHALTGGDQLVGKPHSAYWTDSGTLLFTTTPSTSPEETRAIELGFDDEAGTAEVIWSWGEGEGFFAKVLGEALRLPNGNTVVNFGSEGVVVEITPDGEVGWRLETPTGYFPGHLTFIRDLYDPAAQDGDA